MSTQPFVPGFNSFDVYRNDILPCDGVDQYVNSACDWVDDISQTLCSSNPFGLSYKNLVYCPNGCSGSVCA